MKPTILFRKGIAEEGEFEAANKYFKVVENRSLCQHTYVLPRYSCLPYYKELQDDLKNQHSELVNSYKQHQWIANFWWYEYINLSTPKTWFRLEDSLKDGYNGPWVIKGRTNSRKFEWSTHCYAENRMEAIMVASRLNQDGLIGGQDLIYRKYVPLQVLEYGLNGLPFSNEWRFFFLNRRLIDYGFYWGCAEEKNIPKTVPAKLYDKAIYLAKIAKVHTNFFVLDVAQTESGEAILIEINDGGMSGLSTIPPDRFYSNLKRVCDES